MQKHVIYPHWIVFLRQIFALVLFFCIPVGIIAALFLPEYQYKVYLGLGCVTAFFGFYAMLNYTHTKLIIEEGGLVYRKGWIPNHQNNITWITIKDVNTTAGVLESMFGAGTLDLKVTIRMDEEQIKIGFIPNYEEVFELIRNKIQEMNQGARPISYT